MIKIPQYYIKKIKVKSISQIEKEIKTVQDDILFIGENGEIKSYIEVTDKLRHSDKRHIHDYVFSIEQIPHLDLENINKHSLVNVLLYPFSFVYVRGSLIGYLRKYDLFSLLLTTDEEYYNMFKIVTEFMPQGVAVINSDKQFIYCNKMGLNDISMDKNELIGKNIKAVFNQQLIDKVFVKKEAIDNDICQLNGIDVLASFNPVIGVSNTIEAVVVTFQNLSALENIVKNVDYIQNLKIDLNAVLATYEEILVVSAEGEILRFSENFIDSFWWTDDPQQLIGGNILQFEKEGKLSPSVTRLVLESRKQVSILQQNKTGKSVMAIGIPVFNEAGDIHRIVIHSKDITETVKLKSELHKTKQLTKEYKEQLDRLKIENNDQKKLVYSSAPMERVMDNINKIAQFDSTIMITGESGVGKELVARSIHEQSIRSVEPFLAINCGAIPENLLESELFGYVPGAFTGASEKGKQGFFEKAHKGILFLDEISELSMELQVKLLRVLQEKEVTPIGGTEPISVNVQIISATNKNLADMVKQNKFREDLFYRINVIPITIPPLRERAEDISLLAYHFISELNNKYDKNYNLSPDALRLLEAYSWPGNVRELQNLIERFVVFADDDLITAEFIRPFLTFGLKDEGQVIVTDLLPLKEAQQMLETQLISLALKRYKTTTKAAEVLGVSQSTISRKQNQLNK